MYREQKVTFHNAAGADGNGVIAPTAGFSAVGIQIKGASFVSTVYFEATIDGTNWVGVLGTNCNTGAVATSSSAEGLWQVPVLNWRRFRARLDWTSGTATVTGIFSEGDVEPLADVYLAANSGVDIGDVDVTSIAAGETHIGEVGGNSYVAEVTLSLAAATYTQHDVLAATQIIAACMRKDGGTAVIHSLIVLDQDDQGMALDIVFLRTNASIGAEESTVAPTDAAADEILGIVEILAGDDVDLTNSQLVTKTSVGIVVDAAAGADDLYIAAITRDTPTHTAAGITVKVGFLMD